jgi:hypothetical protein
MPDLKYGDYYCLACYYAKLAEGHVEGALVYSRICGFWMLKKARSICQAAKDVVG